MKIGLPPVARTDALLFILGSLPGEASLAAGSYYAHPRNQFWRLLGEAIDEPLETLDYAARLERLGRRRIGLWDVIASAERAGSLDQAIRSPRHNEIAKLAANYPQVQAVAFNGATAARIGLKLLEAVPSPPATILLPSSSPANTAAFDDKVAVWSQLRDWVAPKSLRSTL